jgi:hypothetical protein
VCQTYKRIEPGARVVCIRQPDGKAYTNIPRYGQTYTIREMIDYELVLLEEVRNPVPHGEQEQSFFTNRFVLEDASFV